MTSNNNEVFSTKLFLYTSIISSQLCFKKLYFLLLIYKADLHNHYNNKTVPKSSKNIT